MSPTLVCLICKMAAKVFSEDYCLELLEIKTKSLGFWERCCWNVLAVRRGGSEGGGGEGWGCAHSPCPRLSGKRPVGKKCEEIKEVATPASAEGRWPWAVRLQLRLYQVRLPEASRAQMLCLGLGSPSSWYPDRGPSAWPVSSALLSRYLCTHPSQGAGGDKRNIIRCNKGEQTPTAVITWVVNWGQSQSFPCSRVSGILGILTDRPRGFNVKCVIDFSLTILSFRSQAMFDTICKELELSKRTWTFLQLYID